MRRPTVDAVRALWLAKFNPGAEEWYDEVTDESGSDVADEKLFPWSHPEQAVRDGNFWLSTVATPRNRTAIDAVAAGDLVVVQRSDPGPDYPSLRSDGATDVLFGLALALSPEAWVDWTTGRWERRVSLVPVARLTWPVPRATARRKSRLRGHSFSRMPQRPDGTGPLGFTLSAVVGDDIADLLAVLGVSPEAMAEPDLARLAARLRATATGNRELWRFRWDHVFRHAVRTAHERAAVARCEEWARDRGYLFRATAERVANAGYDLLFQDATGRELQVEVKGYTATRLNAVHLQPSQKQRAREAATGTPPDWRLYALLAVDTAQPVEHIHTASEVVALLDEGGLQVKGAGHHVR